MPVIYWNCLPVVHEIDSRTNTAYLRSRIPSTFGRDRFDYALGAGTYNIFNALKFLDEPRKWCVDSVQGKVYYWQKDENVMETAGILAPYPCELLRVIGETPQNHVRYLTFDGFSFSIQTGCRKIGCRKIGLSVIVKIQTLPFTWKIRLIYKLRIAKFRTQVVSEL